MCLVKARYGPTVKTRMKITAISQFGTRLPATVHSLPPSSVRRRSICFFASASSGLAMPSVSPDRTSGASPITVLPSHDISRCPLRSRASGPAPPCSAAGCSAGGCSWPVRSPGAEAWPDSLFGPSGGAKEMKFSHFPYLLPWLGRAGDLFEGQGEVVAGRLRRGDVAQRGFEVLVQVGEQLQAGHRPFRFLEGDQRFRRRQQLVVQDRRGVQRRDAGVQRFGDDRRGFLQAPSPPVAER